MKTLQLISLLTSGEKSEFAHQVQILKNKKTAEAFAFLEKEKLTDDIQERLFKKVFKKNWNKKDDYLLRNELRLLNRQLELFIARKRFDQANRKYDAEAAWLYLTALLDREAWHLFEKEWEAEMRRCEADGNLRPIVRLRELLIEYRIRRRNLSEDDIHGLQVNIDLLLRDSTRLSAYRLAEMRLYLAQLVRQRHESNPNNSLEEKPIPKVEIDFDTDPHLGFLENMREAHKVRGKEALDFMLKALPYLEKSKPGLIDLKRANSMLLAQIALEHFLLGNYEEADIWYIKVLEHIESIPEAHHKSAIYLNYVSNLTRLQRYADVLKFIEKHQKMLYTLKEMRERFVCLQVMCMIYGNDIKTAKALIQEHISDVGQTTLVYLRLALGIIFYLQKKTDLVVREMNNLQQSLRNTGQRFEQEIHVSRFFARFSEMMAGEKQERSRTALVRDLAKYHEQVQVHYEILPVRWILNEMEKGL